MFKHILVPLDGSHLAEAALAPAARIAGTLGAPVTLIHIIEQEAPREVHKDRHLTQADEAQAYLREVAARAFPSTVKSRRTSTARRWKTWREASSSTRRRSSRPT